MAALKTMARPSKVKAAPALKIVHEIPAELIAVALAFKGPKIEAPLEPGEFTLRGLVTLSVDVAVLKAEPVEARQGCKLDVAMIITALAERLRLKPSAVAAALEEALHAANRGEVDQLYLDALTPILTRVAGEISEALPRVTRQGATKVTGEVLHTSFEPL
jgi:hypothetical protein